MLLYGLIAIHQFAHAYLLLCIYLIDVSASSNLLELSSLCIFHGDELNKLMPIVENSAWYSRS